MAAASPLRRKLIAKQAITERYNPGIDQTELRREIAAERLADAIRETVAKWPSLTQSQIDRLTGLLRNSGGE